MAANTSSVWIDVLARDKASKVFSKVNVATVALGAAVVKFGKDSVRAYQDSEESQMKLQRAFGKFTKLADTNIEALQGLNKELSRKTVYDDDATASAQALLAQFDLTGKQIERLTPLVQDLASATGQDLGSAAEALGKAFLGNTRALKAVGIEYKATGDRGKDFAAIQALLNEKVGGFAEKEGKTAAGQAKILSNQYGELQETVGQQLMPALLQVMKPLTSMLETFNDLPEPMKQAIVLIGGVGAAAMVAAPKVLALRQLMATNTATGVGSAAVGATGALGRMATFMTGPWGLAITAGTAALLGLAASTRSQEKSTVDLTAALNDNSAAFDVNLRKQIVADLQTRGLLAQAEKLGINVETLTDALMGNSKAQAEVNEQLRKYGMGAYADLKIANDFRQSINLTSQTLVDQSQDALRAARAMGAFAYQIEVARQQWMSYVTAAQNNPAHFGLPAARAAGGPVSAGRAYLVGEAGPELFVPRSTGSIVPNGALSGGAGGAVHIHINGPVTDPVAAARWIREALAAGRRAGVTV